MARIRSIKPEFWTSAQVMECSSTARLLFIGMWNFADDAGRMTYSAKTLKAQILPGDDLKIGDVEKLVAELSANGLILIYSSDDKEFIQVTGWHHQKIDKPKPSKLPEPFVDKSTKRRRKVAPDLILSEGSGGEGKGSESCRADALDDDWPSDFGDQFWRAYPKRVQKIVAMKKLQGLRKAKVVSFADLLAGVRRYAESVKGTEPRFIKNPDAWLNAGRWSDEFPTGPPRRQELSLSEIFENANRAAHEPDHEPDLEFGPVIEGNAAG